MLESVEKIKVEFGKGKCVFLFDKVFQMLMRKFEVRLENWDLGNIKKSSDFFDVKIFVLVRY